MPTLPTATSAAPDAPPQPLLAARGLTCLRGGRVVFSGLDFALSAGEALVLIGANGSGKSSLLRLLAGLSQPATGGLYWQGVPVEDEPEAHRARLRYVGHADAVKPTLTVTENLAQWAEPATAERGSVESRVGSALSRMGLGGLADLPGRYLSAGQKRRVNLARLLLDPVPLWLLDEPTTALDSASCALFAGEVAAHRLRGGAVVVSTHTDLDLTDPRRLSPGDFAVGDAP